MLKPHNVHIYIKDIFIITSLNLKWNIYQLGRNRRINYNINSLPTICNHYSIKCSQALITEYSINVPTITNKWLTVSSLLSLISFFMAYSTYAKYILSNFSIMVYHIKEKLCIIQCTCHYISYLWLRPFLDLSVT